MAKWIIQDREAGNYIDEFGQLLEAEIALDKYEEQDKLDGLYKEDFYEIVYTGVRYNELSTTAKVNCLSNFINYVVPYDWSDINDGDIADLEDTILYWIGKQYYFDADGYWYDEGRQL